MEQETQQLERRLVAANKTIAALMRRVEDKVAGGESAFAVLEQNVALERVVAEKTQQLEARRQELQETLTILRKAQTELMQAQKLESVGRLASGIAHEINTPVQFVSDSVSFVQDSFVDVAKVVGLYRQLRDCGDEGRDELVAAIASAEDDADLQYVLENIPKALERAIDGLGRVATLVSSMKEFAHPEQKEKGHADLNRALSNTLTIARHEYKYVAEISTNYGPLPSVLCHVGELNQAFLNIIVNAAHAIEAAVAGTDRRGEIGVQTCQEGDWVRVSISDTGTGIPKGVCDRIFDPFFTTKEIGKGTGQGLAIAHNVVVDKHGGTLTVETEVGRGTTFHIRLPLVDLR